MNIRKPDPIPFTKEGLAELSAKQAKLLARREVVLVELQRAREQGDLSENGAYKAARFELSDTDRELRRIAHFLKYGEVREARGTETVGFANTVTVELGGKEYRYKLVGTQEADALKGLVSMESPIGMALQGKKVGDAAVVSMPERTIEYLVKKIQ